MTGFIERVLIAPGVTRAANSGEMDLQYKLVSAVADLEITEADEIAFAAMESRGNL